MLIKLLFRFSGPSVPGLVTPEVERQLVITADGQIVILPRSYSTNGGTGVLSPANIASNVNNLNAVVSLTTILPLAQDTATSRRSTNAVNTNNGIRTPLNPINANNGTIVASSVSLIDSSNILSTDTSEVANEDSLGNSGGKKQNIFVKYWIKFEKSYLLQIGPQSIELYHVSPLLTNKYENYTG